MGLSQAWLMYDPEEWLSKHIKHNPNAINLGLDNIRAAAEILKLSKPAPYVITVAGTNGKGSVVKLLDNLLSNLGYRAGCYTSPHLMQFNERICINSKPLSNQEIIAGFIYIYENLINFELNLTYFEFITLAAWYLFSQEDLQIVILEIGLGGRLDAVNIIPKDLAIITSIDFDHQNFLGNTLELIGYEKAGIIESYKPVILGDSNMPSTVYTKANSSKCDIYQYGRDYNLIQSDDDHELFCLKQNDVATSNFNLNNFLLNRNLNKNIKSNNIATSLMAFNLLLKLGVVDSNFNESDLKLIKETVENFTLLGRCSWLNKLKTMIADVSHNVQGVNNLKNFLVQELNKRRPKKIIAIFGMLNDKDISSCFNLMNPIVNQWMLVATPGYRGCSPSLLAQELLKVNPIAKYQVYSDLIACYNEASGIIKQNFDNDIILIIFGSFYIVGPICSYYLGNFKN